MAPHGRQAQERSQPLGHGLPIAGETTYATGCPRYVSCTISYTVTGILPGYAGSFYWFTLPHLILLPLAAAAVAIHAKYRQRRQLLLTAGIALCAALVLGQTLPPAVPSRPGHGIKYLATQLEAWAFVLHGKTYSAMLSRAQVTASPEWTPSAPLPMSPAQAEEIARAELRKLVSDDSTWDVEEFGLRRFRGEAQGKWIYVTPHYRHFRTVRIRVSYSEHAVRWVS